MINGIKKRGNLGFVCGLVAVGKKMFCILRYIMKYTLNDFHEPIKLNHCKMYVYHFPRKLFETNTTIISLSFSPEMGSGPTDHV